MANVIGVGLGIRQSVEKKQTPMHREQTQLAFRNWDRDQSREVTRKISMEVATGTDTTTR